MTDALLVKPHAEPQLSSVAASAATGPPPPALVNGNSAGGAESGYDNPEEPFTIKCVCGYDDDDGDTVQCDKCESWQHIICYYERSADISDEHLCVDCQPRAIDRADATEKQRRQRELRASSERRRKPPTTKSHKKKGKDAATNSISGTPNGWSHHNHDRTSGSPRDQPPPAKRPKTTHRSSGSLNVVSHPPLGPRKRANSATAPTHSPVKSPAVPLTNGQTYDFLSPEFVALCQEPSTFTLIDSNNFSPDHRVIRDLRTWLEDSEALYAVTNKKPQDIFHAYNGGLEDLEKMAPTIHEEDFEFEHILAGGIRPRAKLLRVDSTVVNGAYIGELRGRVGRREDYMSDPTNRWPLLRHPEPFVFFPPSLPIYIDARAEGTRLRYVRRSCDPNVRLKIIITNGGNYHFCIVACKDIMEGDELTINWEVPEEITSRLRSSIDNGTIRQQGMSNDDVSLISRWASCLFANFGGCACQGPCLFDRFDRRSEHLSPTAMKSVVKKSRKNGSHISPPSTGRAVNSRAGSEVQPPGDHDYESADGRSFSGSNRSKPTSRDITPITQNLSEPNFGLGDGLSEREKRKLQQQEERLKQDTVKRTKKRNSAGSVLNTPSVNTSVSSYHGTMAIKRSTDTITQKQPGGTESSDPSPTLSNPNHKLRLNGIVSGRGDPISRKGVRSSSNTSQRRRTSDGSTPKPQPAPKPVYVDCSVQTDPEPLAPTDLLPLIPKKRISYKQSLIEQMRQVRLQHTNHSKEDGSTIRVSTTDEVVESSKPETRSEGTDAPVPTTETTDAKTGMMLPPPLPTPSNPIPNPLEKREDSPSIQLKQEDVEMRDAPEVVPDPTPAATENVVEKKEADTPPEATVQVSQAPPQPPPPPWTGDPAAAPVAPITSPIAVTTPDKRPSPKLADLRLQLPPTPTFSNQPAQPVTPSVGTPGGTSIAQSPLMLTPGIPGAFPSGASMVQPSPVKKKITFSDYTKRKNSEALQAAAAAANPTPGSHGSMDHTLSPVDGSSTRSPVAPRQSPLREDVDMPLAPPEPSVANTNVTLAEVDKVGS